MPEITIHHGDCRDVLPTLPADSVDGAATDPPYHLTSIVQRFGRPGAAPAKSRGATGVYGRASVGFMGLEWDGGDVAHNPDTWAAVLRVLRPGAHLLSFGHPRTKHRQTMAIEAAGFEIRDLLAWLYGSGFPKSHDVAKGIDRIRADDVRPVCRFLRAAIASTGLKYKAVGHALGVTDRMVGHWAAADTDSQPSVPNWDQWVRLKALLGFGDALDDQVRDLNARKGTYGEAWESADIIGQHDGAAPGLAGERFRTGDGTIREPSEAAADWVGWGTALKPALELITLARKPIAEASVARQLLATSTGAINVDGCRVPMVGGLPSEQVGRWPANVVHDGSDEVLAAFALYGDAKGQAGAVSGAEPSGQFPNTLGTFNGSRVPALPRGDSGSAARFFYHAKASSDDRFGSRHPTVKPVDLMRWLVRLITPPGGVVLDPFAGTGTTGVAAVREGFDAILIEQSAEYVGDIRRRVAALDGSDTPLFGGATP